MRIEIPELAVVAIMGASGSGKSTFALKHFKPTEVLSSDSFRAMISDDENNQSVSRDAFDTLYYVANKRLNLGQLTVIDATNVQKEARAVILNLAKEQNCHAVAIVLNLPESVCVERNARRGDRAFGSHVVKRQSEQLRRSIRYLEKEGFRYVYVIDNEQDASEVEIIRKPLWNNKKDESGPFDIIGDVHGCFDELTALLAKLGYQVDAENFTATPPDGRKAIFLGDLCDRGPKNVDVLRLVMHMTAAGQAYCMIGNHDIKLLRYLKRGKGSETHGLDLTLAELDIAGEEFRQETKKFLETLISHYFFDDGKLVAAHAGLKEKFQGRGSGRVKDFCMYGETTGETDEFGLPVRLQWAGDYRGRALVVYGHTPAPEVQSLNNTVCIDTGCVFGGKLTAFRYPEKEIVQVDAREQYYEAIKPLIAALPFDDDMLNIDDVLHQKYLTARLRKSIKIQEENAMAALEIMSRFAADPHWLIYLPPTMSPCETSKLSDYLEYPAEAFDYYKTRGIEKVVCEQKHMGSRAVIVLCKDSETAKARFKVQDGKSGIIYTRTGRQFFEDEATEAAVLSRLNAVLTASGFWGDFQTDWVCLDTELMPWSAKAQKLLEEQYACVGRAGRSGLAAAIDVIGKAVSRQNNLTVEDKSIASKSADLGALLDFYKDRAESLDLYTDAYRQYCWDVESIDDYKIAPFHILATESKVWHTENHAAHMTIIKKNDYPTYS
ncbi:MAG: polynucleotide kinase-phosphatase [Clostridiales bacterium]|jgi:protein phosphatase|nr:polynucleotide kinase-phosphatase [Clostridiales bacterium]